MLDEQDLQHYYPLFFPEARICPDFSSLNFSYELEPLSLFQVDAENFMLIPNDINGWGRVMFLNLTSNTLVPPLYERSGGKWYFRKWSLVVTGDRPDSEQSVFSWNGADP